MFVVIGSVTADLFVMSATPFQDLGGDGFKSSNLVFTETPLTISIGGNGGNSAYVLAGLGVPTALCGAVGKDELGDWLGSMLHARGVDLSGLHRSSTCATSSSTIIMTDAANQVVFHHLGSTRQIAVERIPAELFDRAGALLVSGFPLMPELRARGLAQAFARVRAAGGITALDIGPAIGEPVTADEILPLLPVTDYLIANTHELQALMGTDDCMTAANRLLAHGAPHVVIKQGAAGASIWTAAEKVHVPAFTVQANVSVGAGDSFNAGLLYGLSQAWQLDRVLRFANALAALVVSSRRGVLDSPSLAQVEAFLDAER